MDVTVQFEGYIFAGVAQRSILVAPTTLTGTATEQRDGEWSWFLRYPDGMMVGEGTATGWDDLAGGIRAALVQEAKIGRLRSIRCDTES